MQVVQIRLENVGKSDAEGWQQRGNETVWVTYRKAGVLPDCWLIVQLVMQGWGSCGQARCLSFHTVGLYLMLIGCDSSVGPQEWAGCPLSCSLIVWPAPVLHLFARHQCHQWATDHRMCVSPHCFFLKKELFHTHFDLCWDLCHFSVTTTQICPLGHAGGPGWQQVRLCWFLVLSFGADLPLAVPSCTSQFKVLVI